jgi:hypothetical protein
MFSEIENSILHKCVYEDRVDDSTISRIVLSNLLEKYDFGKGLFRKTLSKSILRPGSIQAK